MKHVWTQGVVAELQFCCSVAFGLNHYVLQIAWAPAAIVFVDFPFSRFNLTPSGGLASLSLNGGGGLALSGCDAQLYRTLIVAKLHR